MIPARTKTDKLRQKLLNSSKLTKHLKLEGVKRYLQAATLKRLSRSSPSLCFLYCTLLSHQGVGLTRIHILSLRVKVITSWYSPHLKLTLFVRLAYTAPTSVLLSVFGPTNTRKGNILCAHKVGAYEFTTTIEKTRKCHTRNSPR